MAHSLPRSALAALAVLGLVAVAGCTQDQSQARVSYKTTVVRNASDDTVSGSTQPGGVYTAYQEPPGFPLTISTTAFLETQSDASGSSADAGTGDSGGDWTRADIQNGSVSVLGDSVCTKQSVDCGAEDCAIELEVPEDGLCVVSVSLVGSSENRASDCWGYGWVDGRNTTPDERDQKHERLIERRDELCSD